MTMSSEQIAAVLNVSPGKDDIQLFRPELSTHGYIAAHQALGAEPPMVSCIMVTRGLIPILRYSAECFRRQTYPHRELVVVCDANAAEVEDFFNAAQIPNVKVVKLPLGFSLGELRNFGIAQASGQIVAQWDDDDLSDPTRLTMSVQALLTAGVAAVFLSSWLFWWPARGLIAVSGQRLWEGSMVSWRGAVPIYPALRRGEDRFVVERMAKCHPIAAIMGKPSLYIYAITGKNTWNLQHYESLFKANAATYLDDDYRQLVEQLQMRVPIVEYKNEIAQLSQS
jgi:glycosyltransferase involved in cell wall biosynthesis